MTDGFGGTSTATVTVNIDGFGAAPALQSSSGATYYGVGDDAVSIDGQFNLAPVGVAFFDGAVATVELTSGQIASDALSIRDEGNGAGQVGVSGTHVSYDGVVVATFTAGSGTSPLTLTFNAAGTELAVERILQSVTYFTSDPVVTGGDRVATFSFVDGNGRASDSATKPLQLGLVYRRELQQGVNNGYGTYRGTSDAQIRESDPDSVIAPSADLLVDFDSAGNASQVLLRYADLFGDGRGQIPLGSVITSANLVVETNPNTSNSPGDGGTLHRMLIDWDDATATWNAFGNGIQTGSGEASAAFESAIGTASGAGSTGTGVLSFSVLPDLQAWADGETNNGWLIQGWENRTDGWFFSSAEDETPTARPKLEIEWVPAGANVVSFREGVNGYSSTVDTEIDSSTADDDLSAAETLFIDSPTSRALVRFDDIIGDLAGQIPAGSKIVTARLRTASTTSNAQGDGARFFPLLTAWNETDTFNSLIDGVSVDGVEAASDYTASAGNPSRNPNVQGGFHDWDVTSDVQAWVNGNLTNYGWLLEPWESGTDGWGLQSSEAANELERPRLEVVFTTAIDPDINITGDNGQAVAAGTTNVSPLAGTDFGSADVTGGTVTKTFTIENAGAAALNISAAEIIGAEAGAFTFTNQPVATVIPGGSFSFDVVFDPSKLGLHDATVVITSDDAGEGVYRFAIQGNGVGFPALSATPDRSTSFTPIGGISSGLSGAEISAFDAGSDRLFVTSDAGLQVVDLADPANPVWLSTIQPTAEGASDNAITSVAVNQTGVVAVAVPGSDPQAPGSVFFYNAADTSYLGSVIVGALPDQLTFAPDGTRLLVANEGEASSDGTTDPVGSVSNVDLSTGVAAATVQTAGFESFDGSEQALRDAGVKLSPGKRVSEDVEPEYIAVSPDGTTAFVTLQENNALAEVDIATATVIAIHPLGYKDHNAANAAIDPTNDSPDALTLQSIPVRGLFQPDAIASYQVDGVTYYVTANEGDARDAEETDVQSVTLDPTMFPNAAALQAAASAGELELSGIVGDPDGDGDYDALYSFGARSFSIWSRAGELVFDSGDVLARASDLLGLYDDGRSDNKGTEPEGITIGQIDGRTYAFVGLERANAIMVFDVTDPTNVSLAQVLNDSADVSPEGLTFISSGDSPNGSPLLVVSNEVSNTLRVYSIGSTSATPQVESVVINDGSASRSQVTSVTVTFDTEVDHVALQSAFTLTNTDSSTQVAGLDIAASNNGGKTIAVLSFAAGASVVTRNGSGLQGNSLADGNYRLDIAASQVRAIVGATTMAVDYAFGGQNAAGTPNDDFFRLLGDANGDGFRNGIDLNSIIPSLFNPNEYRFDLDTNGDGSINGIDLNDLIPTIFGAPRQ
ncbi:MAG: DNRLRE domain-containing protein [Phycisphaera sp. RhM]|nr:DNRLRE domain-containing protein [Phycisphaera sp. RhM]